MAAASPVLPIRWLNGHTRQDLTDTMTPGDLAGEEGGGGEKEEEERGGL